ncbi:MAG: hydroxyacylglutathione hydrolase [Hyphomicrobiales bacterium]|nr:hydroxyacylglutathione hydrolase [Hyphomicrobiales bacterium]MCP5372216.1 hydroxyacylglutathione hydrolase [Hyphomicrobiales bacterium]
MTALDIHQIPVLNDNYVYLARDPGSGACAVVDPAVAKPVLAALDKQGWTLTHILNTHHHMDHVGGNLELKAVTGCTVVGFANDADRIPGIDVRVREGDQVALGDCVGQVFEVPGHTRGHIAYWFAESHALFCGDTLFSMGCGRLFEGTPDQMWRSLGKIRGLPDETLIYCAHEYTNSNADFALTVEPDNPDLRARADQVLALRQAGRPTVPSTLALERRTNPFLRADAPELLAAAGLAGRDPVSAFAEIRRRKDNF